MNKILILAGGTGGHIVPALNIALFFEKNGYSISWLGRKNSLEEKIAKEHSFDYHTIDIVGLRKTSIINWLKMPFLLTKSIYQSIKTIKKVDPVVVIGTGSYIAFSGYIASFLLGKKFFIQEQNTIMGLSNKIASVFATKVFLPLDQDHSSLASADGGAIALAKSSSKYVNVGGNPINPALNYLPPKISQINELNLLVLGGSLGAKFINELIPNVLAKLQKYHHKINLIHQTGQKDYLPTKSLYDQLNFHLKSLVVEPFISDMPKHYTFANLLVARSGAMTISEVSAVGLPAIFIPYPHAVDDHQYHNALLRVNKNAALVIKEDKLNVDEFASIFDKILATGDIGLKVAKDKNYATTIIFNEIIESI